MCKFKSAIALEDGKLQGRCGQSNQEIARTKIQSTMKTYRRPPNLDDVIFIVSALLAIFIATFMLGCQYPTHPISREAAAAIAKSEQETREAVRNITFSPTP